MRLILIEEIPGTGKSTTAAKLCALAQTNRLNAHWFLEERYDHPVHPSTLENRHAPDFPKRCLENWQRFVEEVQTESKIHILEGSGFQSSVRFMMEGRTPGIANYFEQFQAIISALSPVFIYLRPRCTFTHSRITAENRGEIWTGKVSRYLENTPYCCHRKLEGSEGMYSFWRDYAALCDSLVDEIKMPTKIINVIPTDWDSTLPEAADFLTRMGLPL